ncbi:hypothetical protein ABLV17_16775 [Klebsiella sp. CN_Kp091]|uniref:hypothetical protein n=1 Tax=unclassified Klebsiella TaxID=2608929 RepID=UPI0032B4759F
MSTVFDAGGGEPGAAAAGKMSTVVDAGGGPQQGKCLLWSMPVAASRGAYHSRENVYCSRRQ